MNNNNNSRQKIPNIESPIKKNMTNYYNLDYTALQTPTITETPKCPIITTTTRSSKCWFTV